MNCTLEDIHEGMERIRQGDAEAGRELCACFRKELRQQVQGVRGSVAEDMESELCDVFLLRIMGRKRASR
jgi:hypothetical protein